MTDGPELLDELATHAHRTHVVVIGGGIAGLAAALECAKVGMPVTVLEASDRFGGTIATVQLDGLPVDTGATCWSAGGAMSALVDELGLGASVVEARASGVWITGLAKGGAAPVPAQSLLGIPANPWDAGVRRFIGWNGAWRAYLDRLRPPLTIGKERNLAKLVRTRMGDAVLERMVAPLTAGRFGIRPEHVDVTIAAPGLGAALTRTGSLGGAVADVLVDRRKASYQSLEGGLGRIVDALVERLGSLGATLHTGVRVDSIAPDEKGRWVVGHEAHADVVPLAPADALFVATDDVTARGLLSPHLPAALDESMTDAAPRRDIVTLVVDEPALDASAGVEVYAVPGALRASGLVHQTARWEWLATAAGTSRHVLSVAFDAQRGAAAATDGLAPADIAALGRAEASALLGVALGEQSIRAVHHGSFVLAAPDSAFGLRERTDAVRDAVRARPGLAALGAWLSGSGLERVVADAREQAESVRRAALFGASRSN
ncbi:protoporphyrinogen/coproporphyrinogen oxidase [Microbacterium sp. Root166]|uniref:protoporphyrinogen/coproporphyrinogen oxidase n=1 Tax=Microbacterium sp. Root166 TaxID=1736478 RepID=UPI000A3F2A15